MTKKNVDYTVNKGQKRRMIKGTKRINNVELVTSREVEKIKKR